MKIGMLGALLALAAGAAHATVITAPCSLTRQGRPYVQSDSCRISFNPGGDTYTIYDRGSDYTVIVVVKAVGTPQSEGVAQIYWGVGRARQNMGELTQDDPEASCWSGKGVTFCFGTPGEE